jgi:hypothetical protein
LNECLFRGRKSFLSITQDCQRQRKWARTTDRQRMDRRTGKEKHNDFMTKTANDLAYWTKYYSLNYCFNYITTKKLSADENVWK